MSVISENGCYRPDGICPYPRDCKTRAVCAVPIPSCGLCTHPDPRMHLTLADMRLPRAGVAECVAIEESPPSALRFWE
jgi:hypothetical protein